jgi:hypothetical protein
MTMYGVMDVEIRVTLTSGLENAVFWAIKTQFIPHRRHTTSPLQTQAD